MIKKVSYAVGIALSALILSACTLTVVPLEDQPAPAQTRPAPVQSGPVPTSPNVVPNYPLNRVLEYQCVGGRQLVNYTSNESVQVLARGDWQTLTRTVSQDGWFVYRDTHFTWYARGDDGYLEHDGTVIARDCRL